VSNEATGLAQIVVERGGRFYYVGTA